MSEHSISKQGLRVFAAVCLVVLACSWCFAGGQKVDLSNGVIVVAGNMGKVEQKAVSVLQEEIAKRTGITMEIKKQWPVGGKAVIAVGLQAKAGEFAGKYAGEAKKWKIGAEGFGVAVKEGKVAVVAGKDARGVLYGVGRLLRKMYLTEGSILVPGDLSIVSTPKNWLRGHQLGYRPKTNAYDAWTPEIYDQYIRELALFGTNCIEIMPPRTDDKRTSKHMKWDALDMMIKHSEMIDSYGLDVWIWYPNMGDDYIKEKGINEELVEREEIFSKLKRIDHILVPGGDPGHLHPDEYFPWMDRMAEVLNKYHPNAKIWVSPQAMQPTREWLSTFYKYVNAKPKWMGGVCFAPWIKTPIADMRRIVDNDIRIRRYPDITHNVACQYPLHHWDIAHAITSHRECFNPRPIAMKKIHNAFDEYGCGSLTYSEGINDDINKFVWGDQDWDPGMDVSETLRDYSRFLIDAKLADEIAQGFLSQERNWVGPLASNSNVEVTLQQWQDMEEAASDRTKENYRFQMGLMRAYYDGYIKKRLIYETLLESKAMDFLKSAPQKGSLAAMEKAEKTLKMAREEPVAQDYKKKCEALADSLFEKIGSQPTVEKHGAQHRTRGAFMDGIDEPLNDIAWLTSQFKEIRKIKDEAARLEAIDKVVNRTNPGPGGFYDNMGSFSSLKRIHNSIAWEDDPGTLKSPRIAYYYRVNNDRDRDIPMAWKSAVGTIYETPLRLLYEGLDPDAQYKVRITYMGDRSKMIRLVANDVYKVHGEIRTKKPPTREFEIPKEATSGGRLELTWTCDEGQRGSQVSEIWLIKQDAK